MQRGSVLNPRCEPRRKTVHSRGATEKRTNDRPAMAVFASDVRVSDDPGLEIISMFPGEIKRRRKGAGDVTRRTEPLADHDVVRITRPFLRIFPGYPAARLFEDCRAQIGTGGKDAQDSRQGVSCAEHFRRAMGKRDVLAGRVAGALNVAAEERTQYAHVSKAADANVAAAARSGGGAASVVGKKLPVTLLDVSVPMPARGEHELDVPLEVVVRVVASACDERLDEDFAKLEVQRVLPGVEELMIVDARFSPVSTLFAQDVAAGVERGVSGALENAVRMRVSRRQIVADDPVVAVQRGSVVIPVDGHRERVSDEGAPRETRSFVLGNPVHSGVAV